ncbi:MAG TPA: oligosaccharide flippase family protein [Thermoleophilaceae bacterium]
MREAEEHSDPLEAEDLGNRALTGAALLGGRAALIYVFGIVANLVLARLLVPRDFGIVALGTVLLVLGGYLAEGGFGAALIRREHGPTLAELEAVFGFQLAITTALAAVFAAGAAAFGGDGFVVAAMAASLPIAILRLPSMIVLERNLQYRVIAIADVLEALGYYLWAIGAVALGAGVWGLATATIVRAIVGTTTVTAMGPLGVVMPRWSWSRVRPLVGFGAKYQATGLLQVAREQALNVGVAAVAGVSTLGIWNLAWRVLQVPILVFITVNRVAFPSMSRLLAAARDPRPVIERGVAVLAALTGVVTVALVAFAPSLPIVLGRGWADVPRVLLWSGIALVVSAPISVATGGYLFAADAAGVVAKATVASSAAWLAVTLPLLSSQGAAAVGIGWIASGLVYSGALWHATVERAGTAIGQRLVVPTVVGLIATAIAWLAAEQMPHNLVGAIIGLSLGELVLLGGLAGLSRSALRDTRSIIALALRRVPTGPSAA